MGKEEPSDKRVEWSLDVGLGGRDGRSSSRKALNLSGQALLLSEALGGEGVGGRRGGRSLDRDGDWQRSGDVPRAVEDREEGLADGKRSPSSREKKLRMPRGFSRLSGDDSMEGLRDVWAEGV